MANFATQDIEYLRHGDRKIMARIFKPEGPGPFACFIDLHGGAWNNGDLNDRTGLGEYLAERGVVMPTLNFRHGPDGYPTSLADINYGIRWVKAHARELKTRPNRVGIGGAVERRASRHAGGDAAERSALRRDPAAGRLRGGCEPCAPSRCSGR